MECNKSTWNHIDAKDRKGKIALEQLAKPRRFWRAYGEFSIWLCFIVMFGVILLIISAALATAAAPAQQEVLPASDLLLIPVCDQFCPILVAYYCSDFCLGYSRV